MELFKFKRDIPFMSYGKLTTFISLATFILAVFFLMTRGLNLSVEFTGGTLMEVEYASQQGADLNQVRHQLDTLKMGEVQVQALGTNKHIMIRLPNKPDVSSALFWAASPSSAGSSRSPYWRACWRCWVIR